MKMTRIFVVCLVSVLALLLQGCAGFPGNKLPMVTQEQIHFGSGGKIKVFSRWDVAATHRELSDNVRTMGAALAKKNFETALGASGCCTVVDSLDQADIVVDGTQTDESDPAAVLPAVLTGLSLYTIPSWVTTTVHLKASAKHGGKINSYDLSDSSVMVQWLPMAFVFPFSGPFEAVHSVEANTYRTLVVKMNADGLFKD